MVNTIRIERYQFLCRRIYFLGVAFWNNPTLQHIDRACQHSMKCKDEQLLYCNRSVDNTPTYYFILYIYHAYHDVQYLSTLIEVFIKYIIVFLSKTTLAIHNQVHGVSQQSFIFNEIILNQIQQYLSHFQQMTSNIKMQ